MKRFGHALILALIVASSAFSLEVRGRVVSADGNPVAEAIVLHRPSGARSSTDRQGAFVLDVPDAEKVSLEVIHPDYVEEEFRLSARDIAKGATLTVVPYIRQREEVLVTALRYPEPATEIPAAGTVLTADAVSEKMPSNITEAVQNTPGVSILGSGGFSLVPTIRGLARRRVLVLIDNVRVFSDRRTGPNASFVSPADIARVEVLRSPSSIFYGSDAIGGVFHIFTKQGPPKEGLGGSARLGYGTVNDQKSYGLAVSGLKKGWGFYLSFQAEDAANYSSPRAEVLQSQFTQRSLFGKLEHRSAKRDVVLSFLGGRGVDIGKPNRDSLAKPTWYPRENQNLVHLNWLERDVARGELTFHAYANPNFLETRTDRIEGYKTKESFSKTQSTDFGFQASYGKKWSPAWRFNAGLDYFGQQAAAAENKETSFDAQGGVTKVFTETPYDRGVRSDLGLFASVDFSGLRNLDLVGGLRWDYLHQRAHPGGAEDSLDSTRRALTGFLAASYKLAESLVAFANVSRAYRAPSLGERFYTGITGRGFIIAQPGLKPETSLNMDAGLKLFSSRVFAGVYAFFYRVDGLIERYLVSDRVYTYGNVDRGDLKGLEFELEYFPLPGWKVFGNLATLKGVSTETDAPLNDVPPFRLFAGTRLWFKRLSFEVNGVIQSAKDRPGPAEIAIPGHEVLNFRAAYAFGSTVHIYAVVSNVFDRFYLARPDPEAMEEPGRSFSLGLNYSF